MHSSPNSKAYIIKYNHKHTHFYKLSHFLTHVTLLSHPYTIIHNVVTWHTLTCTYAHSYSVPHEFTLTQNHTYFTPRLISLCSHIFTYSHIYAHTKSYTLIHPHVHTVLLLDTHVHSHLYPLMHQLPFIYHRYSHCHNYTSHTLTFFHLPFHTDNTFTLLHTFIPIHM